jgi:thiamine monophosphate synthase
MRSLDTGAMTEDALRTVSKILPPQVILGATIEAVEEAAVALKDVAQYSSLSNIIVQIVLS